MDSGYQAVSSIQFSCSVTSDSLWPHGLQHTRLSFPSLSPRVSAELCPLSQWCHPTTSFSDVHFCSCPQSFPASGSFPVSWHFTSGGQGFGALASASVFPMNIQSWFTVGLTGLILLSKGLSRVFSSTTIVRWLRAQTLRPDCGLNPSSIPHWISKIWGHTG